jgi:uncharacterized surface protein with fasciclin (FAS1) repeats
MAYFSRNICSNNSDIVLICLLYDNFGTPEKRSFMRNYTKRLLAVLIVGTAIFFAGCATEDNVDSPPAPIANIADIVARDPNFSMLNAAVTRAGLTSALTANDITLLGADNLTFQVSGIPDIAAINAIPVATLQAVLSYHIITKRVSFAAVPATDTLKTVSTLNVYGSKNPNGTFFNGIKIRTPDKAGSNGYIQVLERVLTPPAPTKTIANVFTTDTTFSFMLKAVTKLNLLTLLTNGNKLTVFAPNNAAFRATGITDVDAVPVAVLDAVIKGHIVGTNIFSSDFINTSVYPTKEPTLNVVLTTTPVLGVRFTTSAQPAAPISLPDNVCTNGVIHTISRVMLQ